MIDNKKFERHMRDENLSENPISSYLFAVKQFSNQYDEITLKNLRAYKVWLIEGYKPKTVNLRLRAINCYLESIGKERWKLPFVRVQQKAFLENVISEADYEKLITEVVGKRAKKRALHLLEQMDRSERKLREKLTQGGYPDCCVDAAIDYVKSFHYLDDYRFASTYVRYHQDSLSRRQLEQKLMTKGIGRDDINCAIDSEYTADEEKHIAKLLEKKHYDPDNCDEKEFRRIYQFLMRRGFKSSQILSAMRSQLP